MIDDTRGPHAPRTSRLTQLSYYTSFVARRVREAAATGRPLPPAVTDALAGVVECSDSLGWEALWGFTLCQLQVLVAGWYPRLLLSVILHSAVCFPSLMVPCPVRPGRCRPDAAGCLRDCHACNGCVPLHGQECHAQLLHPCTTPSS